MAKTPRKKVTKKEIRAWDDGSLAHTLSTRAARGRPMHGGIKGAEEARQLWIAQHRRFVKGK